MIGRRLLKLNRHDLSQLSEAKAQRVAIEKMIRRLAKGDVVVLEFEPPVPDAAVDGDGSEEDIAEEALPYDQEDALKSSFRNAIDFGNGGGDGDACGPPPDLSNEETPLKRLSWTGIPGSMRVECWRILVGFSDDDIAKYAKLRRAYYVSVDGDEACHATLEAVRGRSREPSAKREASVANGSPTSPTPDFPPNVDMRLKKQVDVDVFRMQPGCLLFRTHVVRGICTRILYIWGRRHPASGYVQGMDAVLSPFIVVNIARYFKTDLLEVPSLEALNSMLASLSSAQLLAAEAAAYYSVSFLLSHVQNFYTPWQPGVFATARRTRRLVRRVDRILYSHMMSQGVDFLTFICRWATCLLVRELPLPLAIRMYDAYLAMGPACADFHVYMCGAFLLHHRDLLLRCDFGEMMAVLGSAGLPAKALDEDAVGVLLSKAYLLQRQYAHAVEKGRTDDLGMTLSTVAGAP